MFQTMLDNNIYMREMNGDEFWPLWEKIGKPMFQNQSPIFYLSDCFNEQEAAKNKELKNKLGQPLRIYLGLFDGDEFIGWSWGLQESADTFYMANSGVLPQHRRNGFYIKMLDHMVVLAEGHGFQKIYSRHTVTNNSIIIPKLRRGFVISSIEISPAFGALVHLCYFPKPLIKKIMNFRVGEIRPDEEIKHWLKLD